MGEDSLSLSSVCVVSWLWGSCPRTDLNTHLSLELWRPQWYSLSDAERPLACLEPREVFVKQLKLSLEDVDLQIWPLVSKPRLRGQQRGPRAKSLPAELAIGSLADDMQDEQPTQSDDDSDVSLEEWEKFTGEEAEHFQLALEEAMLLETEEDEIDNMEAECVQLSQQPHVGSGGTSNLASSSTSTPPPLLAQEGTLAAEAKHRASATQSLGFRMPAECHVVTAHGSLKFYTSTNQFVAECIQEGHGKCRLTRSALPNPNRPAQGRPLGLLCAWLQKPCCDRDVHLVLRLSFAERCLAREQIAAFPEGANLLGSERLLREGEGVEPEQCP
eukprot:6484745-Amphidinium_carterae.2